MQTDATTLNDDASAATLAGMPDDALTTQEAARALGVHPAHVTKLCRDGQLTARRFGRAWMIEPDEKFERQRDLIAPTGRPRTGRARKPGGE